MLRKSYTFLTDTLFEETQCSTYTAVILSQMHLHTHSLYCLISNISVLSFIHSSCNYLQILTSLGPLVTRLNDVSRALKLHSLQDLMLCWHLITSSSRTEFILCLTKSMTRTRCWEHSSKKETNVLEGNNACMFAFTIFVSSSY